MKNNITKWLNTVVDETASDLYLTADAPPSIRVHGRLIPLEEPTLQHGDVDIIAHELMNEKQAKGFEDTSEMNFAHSENNIGRFRVNVFRQRNETAMVFRLIPAEIPTPESLGLPPVLKELVMQKRGLILFVGAAGSGKSTSMASLIEQRNQQTTGHIITIEDPIEYTHHHNKSLVNQREIGSDTLSYENALRNTLRQAPDVILIGEIRTQETMEHAISFAETGHLCMSTLHANNANQALSRIINFFPEDRHGQVFLDLSLNLRAIVSQRLIPSLDGKRVVAVEVLIGSPLVCDMIKRGDIHSIKEVMQKSENIGMQTFDASLFNLYKGKKISLEEALRNADSQNNLRLRIALSEGVDPAEAAKRFSLESEAEGFSEIGALRAGKTTEEREKN